MRFGLVLVALTAVAPVARAEELAPLEARMRIEVTGLLTIESDWRHGRLTEIEERRTVVVTIDELDEAGEIAAVTSERKIKKRSFGKGAWKRFSHRDVSRADGSRRGFGSGLLDGLTMRSVLGGQQHEVGRAIALDADQTAAMIGWRRTAEYAWFDGEIERAQITLRSRTGDVAMYDIEIDISSPATYVVRGTAEFDEARDLPLSLTLDARGPRHKRAGYFVSEQRFSYPEDD